MIIVAVDDYHLPHLLIDIPGKVETGETAAYYYESFLVHR